MAEEQELIPDDVKQIIKQTFSEQLKDDVSVEVYTLAGINDQFNDSAIDLVRPWPDCPTRSRRPFTRSATSSPKSGVVTRSPSVLIAPDKYRIRYTGRPDGRRRPVPARSDHDGILGNDHPVRAVDQEDCRPPARSATSRSSSAPPVPTARSRCSRPLPRPFFEPDLISAEAIEIYENHDLAESLGSLAVPQTFMNGTFTGAGLQPEPMFVESLLTLKEPQMPPPQISGEPHGKGPRHHRRRARRPHGRHLRGARRPFNCVVIEKIEPRRPGGDHARWWRTIPASCASAARALWTSSPSRRRSMLRSMWVNM